jgi:hydrogenase assembly chaperone HypC/HupF
VSGAVPSAGVSCDCITCGDEAIPMRVRQLDRDRGLALCENEAGARSSVEIALVEPVAVGEMLLVHAGTAIAHGPTGTTQGATA